LTISTFLLYTSHMNKIIGEEDAKLTRLLGLLYRTERTAESRVNGLLQAVDLTCAQHHVLQLLISVGEPLPLGQIAENLHTVRSNITQMVDRLAAEGLVTRIFDPTDRRRVLAQITEEGRRRSETAAQVENQVKQDLLVHFSPEERDQLLTLLSRLEKVWK
jgi:DNA-binding MarR family transcriptional regulator